MDPPAIYDLTVLDDVVVRMLRGGKTRMICENAKAVADPEPVEDRVVRRDHLAVLLRDRRDPHTRVAAVEIEHATISAGCVVRDGPTIFESAIAPASTISLFLDASRCTTEASTVNAVSSNVQLPIVA